MNITGTGRGEGRGDGGIGKLGDVGRMKEGRDGGGKSGKRKEKEKEAANEGRFDMRRKGGVKREEGK